jgi:hypothetical protein
MRAGIILLILAAPSASAALSAQEAASDVRASIDSEGLHLVRIAIEAERARAGARLSSKADPDFERQPELGAWGLSFRGISIGSLRLEGMLAGLYHEGGLAPSVLKAPRAAYMDLDGAHLGMALAHPSGLELAFAPDTGIAWIGASLGPGSLARGKGAFLEAGLLGALAPAYEGPAFHSWPGRWAGPLGVASLAGGARWGDATLRLESSLAMRPGLPPEPRAGAAAAIGLPEGFGLEAQACFASPAYPYAEGRLARYGARASIEARHEASGLMAKAAFASESRGGPDPSAPLAPLRLRLLARFAMSHEAQASSPFSLAIGASGDRDGWGAWDGAFAASCEAAFPLGPSAWVGFGAQAAFAGLSPEFGAKASCSNRLAGSEHRFNLELGARLKGEDMKWRVAALIDLPLMADSRVRLSASLEAAMKKGAEPAAPRLYMKIELKSKGTLALEEPLDELGVELVDLVAHDLLLMGELAPDLEGL